MIHSNSGHLAALAVLAVCAWSFVFVVFWVLTGWGAAIAVRSYRWAMRNHYKPNSRPTCRSVVEEV